MNKFIIFISFSILIPNTCPSKDEVVQPLVLQLMKDIMEDLYSSSIINRPNKPHSKNFKNKYSAEMSTLIKKDFIKDPLLYALQFDALIAAVITGRDLFTGHSIAYSNYEHIFPTILTIDAAFVTLFVSKEILNKSNRILVKQYVAEMLRIRAERKKIKKVTGCIKSLCSDQDFTSRIEKISNIVGQGESTKKLVKIMILRAISEQIKGYNEEMAEKIMELASHKFAKFKSSSELRSKDIKKISQIALDEIHDNFVIDLTGTCQAEAQYLNETLKTRIEKR